MWVDGAAQIGNTPMHYLCENAALSLPMLQAIMDVKRANVTISNSVGPPPPHPSTHRLSNSLTPCAMPGHSSGSLQGTTSR